ncbi:hypothetical protein CAEBREN_00311 [Caenorhabditis brenneri]|uniref:SPK domain-containing protein n=1 Tax=Caenorhabditis brenneri TaxID=135651 RepID=G0NFS9_CAEBE|nr:hypothetical protein CAEBREN_00311 [Caenorhabditis brenneri]
MSLVDLRKWSAEPINAKLIEFLIEKTKYAELPINCTRLAEEFYTSTHLTNGVKAIQQRIDRIRSKILYLEDIDWKTRLKILFVLSVPVDVESIGSLQQNALVRVDERKRIIEYKSNDGSLHLQGKHDCYSKRFISGNDRRTSGGRFMQLPKQAHDENLEEDPEEDDLSNDSDDGIDSYFDDNDDHQISRDDNEQTEVSDKRLSRKQRRPDDADFSNDSGTLDFESTSSPKTACRSSRTTGSKRTSSILNINTPRETSNKRKTDESSTDTQKRARKSNNAESNVPVSGDFRTDDLENYDPNPSSVHSSSVINGEGNGEVRDGEHQNQDVRQNNVNNDYEEVQVGPRTIDASNVRKTSENPRPVVPMTQIPEELVQVKEEVMTEEEEDVKPTLFSNRTLILQILQGLHTLIVSLYHPSLETLQKEIEERMKRFEGSGTSIPIAQIVWTMELCFSKMTESSVRISSEGPQFINLRVFLCYLKSFILNLKIEELKSVMDKINECVQGCQNKRARVKKVEEILRVTLDIITI